MIGSLCPAVTVVAPPATSAFRHVYPWVPNLGASDTAGTRRLDRKRRVVERGRGAPHHPAVDRFVNQDVGMPGGSRRQKRRFGVTTDHDRSAQGFDAVADSRKDVAVIDTKGNDSNPPF